MSEPQQSDSPEGVQPGKTRTMWHPLLVRMLRFTLGSAFEVQEEVYVGKVPLRVDIILVRREGGEVSETWASTLSGLLPLLNRFTLIEFKGPTDTMERGDFAQLLGCSFLWHAQESELVSHDAVSLIVLTPRVSGPLRDEVRALGGDVQSHEAGIFRVAGLPFVTWLVETDVMAEQGQPVLSLVSRAFLNDRQSIIEKLAHSAYADLVQYMVQQVEQFRSEEDFAMQQVLSENLKEFSAKLRAKFLEETPVEERLRGLSPEELLAGLSAEERARLRELLERAEGGK
jgi:hypothetical protein